MTKGLLIIGAGGNGKVAAGIAKAMNKWSEIAFIDDNKVGDSISGFNVIGATEDLNDLRHEFSEAFISIADIPAYFDLKAILVRNEFEIPLLIHPESYVSPTAKIGSGTMVCPKAVIHVDAEIDEDCIINTSAVVEHDCVIKARTHIAPSAVLAGNVTVGANCWIGLNASVNQNLEINDEVTIGAGAVVTKNLTEPGTYVGVPAKKI